MHNSALWHAQPCTPSLDLKDFWSSSDAQPCIWKCTVVHCNSAELKIVPFRFHLEKLFILFFQIHFKNPYYHPHSSFSFQTTRFLSFLISLTHSNPKFSKSSLQFFILVTLILNHAKTKILSSKANRSSSQTLQSFRKFKESKRGRGRIRGNEIFSKYSFC